MVARSSYDATLAKLDEANRRITKLEAEASVSGQILHELIAETGATDEQVINATLRACGLNARPTKE